LVEAEVTLVAAEATARGVTFVVRAVVVRCAVLRAALVVPLAPAVLAAAGLAEPAVFAAPGALVVRARELARTEFAVRTGAALAVAFFVGGTNLLPPIVISYRGGHSTESNVLHIQPGKTPGKDEVTATFRYCSSGVPGGSSSCTIRSASSGEAPRPTATPIR
jgi:hypothetical protein